MVLLTEQFTSEYQPPIEAGRRIRAARLAAREKMVPSNPDYPRVTDKGWTIYCQDNDGHRVEWDCGDALPSTEALDYFIERGRRLCVPVWIEGRYDYAADGARHFWDYECGEWWDVWLINKKYFI